MSCARALPRSRERTSLAAAPRPATHAVAPGASIVAPSMLAALVALAAACSPAPPPPDDPRLDVSALFPTAAPSLASPPPAETTAPIATVAPAETAACRADDDCRYDPVGKRCGADPRYNKQPPLVDQGIVCYCDATAASCALLRVDPAPCEGDTSCAVRLDPRPHPVRADAAHPYRKPRACRSVKPGAARRTDRHATCERTNICTMHTRECGEP